MKISVKYLWKLILVLLFTANSQFINSQGYQTGNPSPVAWWKFDSADSRKVIDQITSVRDSIQGNFRLADGVKGKALKLDGFTTVIRLNSQRAPKISGSFTCEAWIAAATYPWNWCPILAQEKKEVAGFYFGVGPQGQVGIFASVNGVWQKCETKTKIPFRKWTHLVATFDEKSGFKIYIDGILSGQLNISGKLVPASESDLLIGMNREMTAQSNPVRTYATLPGWFSFDGIYDEIKIYDIAITADIVKARFADHTGIMPPDIPQRIMPSGPDGRIV